MTFTTLWPEARTEALRQLCAKGLSYGIIAKELGVTRNAVIGKAARLHISNGRLTLGLGDNRITIIRHGRPAMSAVPKSRRGTFKWRKKPPPAPIMVPVRSLPRPEVPMPESLKVSLIDLKPHQCRFPEGHGPFLFCGHPTFEGASYCGAHCKLCWQPPEARKSRAKQAVRDAMRAA